MAPGLRGAARGQRPRPHRRVRRLGDAVAAAYDVVVALSRSGTTTEVAHALMRSARSRTVAITAVPDSPVAHAADEVVELEFADEQSVVQTRFATTALSLLRAHEGLDLAASVADAAAALDAPLPVEPGRGRPLGVPRPRLDRRAGQRGGAEAARVGPGVDRGLPGLRVPPRPDQHRRARAPSCGPSGPPTTPARGRPRGRRARPSRPTSTRSPRSCSPSGRRSRSPRPPGSTPTGPRNLTRSVVLRRCRSDPHQLLAALVASCGRGRLRRRRQRRQGLDASRRAREDHDVARPERHRGQGPRTSSPTLQPVRTRRSRSTRAAAACSPTRCSRRSPTALAVRLLPRRRLHLRLRPRQPGTPDKVLDLTDDVKKPELPLGRLLRAGPGGDDRQRPRAGAAGADRRPRRWSTTRSSSSRWA